jgi:hypothetical protein
MRRWDENDPVFVNVAEFLQKPERVFIGLLSVVRLFRFDNFLRCAREALEFFEPVWIKAAATRPGIFEDGELGSWMRRCRAHTRELPREVIEARAEVVDYIANKYAKTNRCDPMNLQAIQVESWLRIFITDESVRVVPHKLVTFAVERFKVLLRSGEFPVRIVKGGGHVTLQTAPSLASRRAILASSGGR